MRFMLPEHLGFYYEYYLSSFPVGLLDRAL